MLKNALLLGLSLTLAIPALIEAAPHFGYRVVKSFPHDTKAFTEGLEYRNGFLWESTGLNGQSTIRKEDLDTGKVLLSTSLDPKYFGEGITIIDGHMVGLTWQTNVGFLYDVKDLHSTSSFYYPGEGWALTNDGTHIYMSDGTSEIRVWNPKTLMEERRIKVHDGDRVIDQVNELEYIHGEIWANVWMTSEIIRIDPKDGHIIAWIDMAGLLAPEERRGTDVLNGIAYDAATNRIFVTGKLWPHIFQIELGPQKH